MFDVSVVIPTYRRPELLLRCLDALMLQDLPANRFEIIVADDGASIETEALVYSFRCRYPRRTFVYIAVSPKGGPAAARNCGWRRARAPIVAFTDDDCIPGPQWLTEGLAAFTAGVSAVSGGILMPLTDRPTDYELNAAGLASAEFVTANCFCLRSVLEEVGGFDERFRHAWREDSDLHFNLLERNYCVVQAPGAVIVHPIRPSWFGISLKQQRNNLFEALLFLKHPELYRAKIGSFRVRNYYAIVASLIVSVWAMFSGHSLLAWIAVTMWGIFTLEFMMRRLQNTARDLRHVWEMLVTSIAIPPAAVFWRVAGAVRFRVVFF